MKEIRSLTGLRGIAALYVCIYHFFMSAGANYKILIKDKNIFIQNFISHGYLSVDLFFILSGFVLSLSSNKTFSEGINKTAYSQFLIKRFCRIYPIYFITLLGANFIFGWCGFRANILNALLIQVPFSWNIIPPSWSLSVEWYMYLIFPFLFLRIKKVNISIIIPFIVLICIIYLHSSSLRNGDLDIYSGILPILRGLSDYIIGICVYNLYKNKNVKLNSSFISVLILISLFFSHTDVFVILLFSLLVLSYTKTKDSKFLSSKVIYFLGEISYSLYLLHAFFIYILEQNNLQFNALACIGFFVILIIVSYLSYYFIEKKLSRNILNLLNKMFFTDQKFARQ